MGNEQPLAGLTFVFTGDMKMEREEARSRVTLLGGRVTTSVSGKTTHLVAGDEPGPSKLQKAKANGITILNEEEFLDLIQEKEKDEEREENRVIGSEVACFNYDFAVSEVPWSEKYRPLKIDDFVGNKQMLGQLEEYLKGNTSHKAVLLSGPPGIGKTTAAHLITHKLGFEPIEFNASDIRSKKSIAEQIGSVLNNSLISFNKGKRVVIMDEVDGMTSDRGGIPELLRIIKKTTMPIICICNDRTHIKMRSLANNCLDLRFRKPDSRMILPRARAILEKENKQLSDGLINEIIARSNGDLRATMNGLQAATSSTKLSSGMFTKSVSKGLFDLAAGLFHKDNIDSKLDMFFDEYDMLPLFVHENYIKSGIANIQKAADSISYSDVIDGRIHGTDQDWSLLKYFGFFSCVYPTNKLKLQTRLDFPSFLGQNSKRGRIQRVVESWLVHCKDKITANDMKVYAMSIFSKKFLSHLKTSDIKGAIEILTKFDFLKEDLLEMIELTHQAEYKAIPAKLKTAFSREYNKLKRSLPYEPTSSYSPIIEDDESL